MLQLILNYLSKYIQSTFSETNQFKTQPSSNPKSLIQIFLTFDSGT